MRELATIVGFIAGMITTAANLPQMWKRGQSAKKGAESKGFDSTKVGEK